MIPVIDMKNYYNAYLYENEIGYINAWKYYFTQPSGISVDEALSFEDHVTVDCSSLPSAYLYKGLFENRGGELAYWRKICKKYINFSPAVLERLEAAKEKFQGKKILGVSLRGTDYVTCKPHDHPIQPEPEEVIAKTQEVMRAKNYDLLYLSSEDKKIIAKFQSVFGEKLILPEGKYVDFNYNDSEKFITLYSTGRENDKYIMGLEYIVSKLLLRECNGLITSLTSGSESIMLLSDGFEYLYVFDLGMYP